MLNLFRTTAAPAAEAGLKGKQLAHGRTAARLDRLSTDLDAARVALAEAEFALGETELSEGDTSMAAAVVQEAAAKVKSLEAAIAVAQAKAEQAKTERRNAELLASIEAEFEAIARLKLDIGPSIDQWMAAGRELADALAKGLDAARTTAGLENSWIKDVQLYYRTHLLEAVSTMIPEGRAHSWNYRSTTFSDRIPSPETARTRKRGR